MSTEIMTEDYSDLERSPSRMGFTRPPLRKSNDLGCVDAAVVEDDDEKWEFAGALLVPSQSTSSEGSDSSDDFEPLDASTPDHKPALSARTASLTNIPMQLPVVAPVEVDLPYYRVATPVAASASCPGFMPADHGLSRSALSHLKGFWSARHDEYAKLEAQLALAEADPYGGIMESPRSRDGLRAALFSRLSQPGLRSPRETGSSRTAPPNLNAPIYPRTGDLTTLRDSRYAGLDRVFRNLTLNSINKILFLHDMLERAPDASPETPHTPAVPAGGDDSTFVDISLSSGTSCDATLIAEDEPSFCAQRACGAKHETLHTTECDRAWEIDWLARWKVLLARVKADPLLPPAPGAVDEKAFWAALRPPKPARFFIPADDDEFFGLESDDGEDGEDDDDYGEMLARPAYGVSADSLSREFLHSLCEYRLSIGM